MSTLPFLVLECSSYTVLLQPKQVTMNALLLMMPALSLTIVSSQ